MANDSPEIPHGMKRIYQRFAGWRSAHPGVRLLIPATTVESGSEGRARAGSVSHGAGSASGVRHAETHCRVRPVSDPVRVPQRAGDSSFEGIAPYYTMDAPRTRLGRTRSVTSLSSFPRDGGIIGDSQGRNV